MYTGAEMYIQPSLRTHAPRLSRDDGAWSAASCSSIMCCSICVAASVLRCLQAVVQAEGALLSTNVSNYVCNACRVSSGGAEARAAGLIKLRACLRAGRLLARRAPACAPGA